LCIRHRDCHAACDKRSPRSQSSFLSVVNTDILVVAPSANVVMTVGPIRFLGLGIFDAFARPMRYPAAFTIAIALASGVSSSAGNTDVVANGTAGAPLATIVSMSASSGRSEALHMVRSPLKMGVACAMPVKKARPHLRERRR
jgi:hypothetical protein